MNKHVAEIDDHPLAEGDAVDAQGMPPVIFVELLLEFVCDGLELGLGVARTDHEEIREGRDTPEVDDDDVFGFFIQGGLATEDCQLFAGQRTGRGHGNRSGAGQAQVVSIG